MLLPQTAEYAVRAVLRIAARHPAPVSVAGVADGVDVPRNYLAKTLHLLMRAGVLRSARGPGGGYRLAIAPDELTLGTITAPFRPTTARQCLIRRAPCGVDSTCLVHERWQPAAREIDQFFATTTVADLLAEPAAFSTTLQNL